MLFEIEEARYINIRNDDFTCTFIICTTEVRLQSDGRQLTVLKKVQLKSGNSIVISACSKMNILLF